MGGTAFTRAVSPKLAECALTHLDQSPIDAARASLQHDAYESRLRAAGLEIVRLPDLPEHPDGVFVEDTAVLLDGHAIITRPGAPSRAGEVDSTIAGLAGHAEILRLERGHVDGGDVLRVSHTLYVGLSSRTDPEGIAELGRIASRLGFQVIATELRDCLHLKTAATLAGHDKGGNPVLIYNRQAVDPRHFAGVDAVAVDEREPYAANVLGVGGRVIMPSGYPRTAEVLRSRGFTLDELDVSELEKAEAGVTCLSLLNEAAQLS